MNIKSKGGILGIKSRGKETVGTYKPTPLNPIEMLATMKIDYQVVG